MTDRHPENHQNHLATLFKERGPIRTIGVIGMGYVGIPAAVLFADIPGITHVYGFQRDSKTSGYKIAMLNRGESPLKGEEPGLEPLLKKVVSTGTFSCTPDFTKIADCDAVTLAIQTPFLNHADLLPDFTPLIDGLRHVGQNLRPGMLVVLESTITPGTTAGMARQILEEESGLVAGRDFALAHAPERVMVGRLLRNIREHDRIVGGIDPISTERAVELYTPVLTTGRVIPMTATAAEVTKTAENTFRDLQIAAANQLALYCEAMGVNFYDVRAGIDSLKGEGITRAILWPGAGVGGHCLTKDTYHLERGVQLAAEARDTTEAEDVAEVGNAAESGKPGKFPVARKARATVLDYPEGRPSLYTLAREINDFMPAHMLHLTVAALAEAGKPLKGARIALLGWAFINDSDDARNSPSDPFYQAATAAGAEVRVHDPWVDPATSPDLPSPDQPDGGLTMDLEQALAGADAVVIFTGHAAYRGLVPEDVKRWCGCERPAIVDGRNVVEPEEWVKAGFVYKGVGRGDL
ncbi:UDP-N-acetyl-D-mannosaminuronic acid dehydrogenase [Methanocalculus alkaliphilus]|uniref:nucleotide sugar dehydrogenase n=1 Tax=Methanocalculus alkaliphilus TaxID=768730 RepID=UPI00209F3DBA|nr:nucleotide sugar dehydrogenase [Methanocalculus alkaliphilus]MCP1715120.1 UDP-N-acetyl-D-mannosaminuronic acid dehydrogenase [Methanocalculus alkaliphilus]